jgi:hypothetical protein
VSDIILIFIISNNFGMMFTVLNIWNVAMEIMFSTGKLKGLTE